jgi:hypothetical protein
MAVQTSDDRADRGGDSFREVVNIGNSLNRTTRRAGRQAIVPKPISGSVSTVSSTGSSIAAAPMWLSPGGSGYAEAARLPSISWISGA